MTNPYEAYKRCSVFLCILLISFWLPGGASSEMRLPFARVLSPLRGDSVATKSVSSSAKDFLVEADFLRGDDALWPSGGDTCTLETTGQLLDTRFILPLQVVVSSGTSPRWVRLRAHRYRTNQTLYLLAHRSGTLAGRNLRPLTVFQASWDVTRCLGQWRITIDSVQLQSGGRLGFASQHARFVRIDKRQQVVELGRAWAAKHLTWSNQNPFFTACDSFVGYLYTTLGLPAPTLTLSTTNQRFIPDSGPGSLRFFFWSKEASDPCHISVRSTLCSVIDNNWGNSGIGPQEHLGLDPWQVYCSWRTTNCSPEDPQFPGQSLFDTD